MVNGRFQGRTTESEEHLTMLTHSPVKNHHLRSRIDALQQPHNFREVLPLNPFLVSRYDSKLLPRYLKCMVIEVEQLFTASDIVDGLLW